MTPEDHLPPHLNVESKTPSVSNQSDSLVIVEIDEKLQLLERVNLPIGKSVTIVSPVSTMEATLQVCMDWHNRKMMVLQNRIYDLEHKG